MARRSVASHEPPAVTHGLYYPNRMGRIILTAMEDVMGRHGVNATLHLAGLHHLVDQYPPNDLQPGFGFEELAAIQATLDDLFGKRAGRGLAHRTGRETFKYALSEFMPVMGIADLAFRPLHLGLKLRIGLQVFAETFNKFTDQIVVLDDEHDRHIWSITQCPVCWKRMSQEPCCQLAVGLLHESLSWVSNGRKFVVWEESCIAVGDPACTIHILKAPLD
jgi:predicted hydrocarbon binding protein